MEQPAQTLESLSGLASQVAGAVISSTTQCFRLCRRLVLGNLGLGKEGRVATQSLSVGG